MLNAILANKLSDFTFVKVSFSPNDDRRYTYKTTLKLEVGDKVVVESPSGLKIVRVEEVLPPYETSFQIKWIVDWVNTEQYSKLKEIEAELHKDYLEALAREELEAKYTEFRTAHPALDQSFDEKVKRL